MQMSRMAWATPAESRHTTTGSPSSIAAIGSSFRVAANPTGCQHWRSATGSGTDAGGSETPAAGTDSMAIAPRYCLRAGQLDRALQHRVDHRAGQLAGERVLLGGVVTAQQHPVADPCLGTVAELRPGPGHGRDAGGEDP